ncbi:MAG: MoxR family ATPase, partial [Lachnospiraceae bacterium]|nr:MoxR family ATPase [Lachnospiraceae bacterium]
MNIKRAKTEIKNTLRAYLQKKEDGSYRIPAVRQRPVLLIGPPGIGKTAIMEQIAAECGVGLVAYTITHHTRQSAVGLPFIERKVYGGREYSVTEYTMSEIIAAVYEKIEQTGVREGILFIDEINCVSETLAPTMLQFLQCKTFGNQRVPEGWLIVAAGNPPEYNRSVREFDIVTLDRVKHMDIEADYEVWKEYAYRQGLHSAVTSYLDIRRDDFYSIRATVEGKQFVTARGWEDLSEFLYACEELDIAVDEEVVKQYVAHPQVAKSFAAYLELYRKYRTDYDVNAVLSGNYADFAAGKLKNAAFDERYSVLSLLLDRLAGEFREVWMEEAVVTKLYELLKKAKVELLRENAPADAPARLEETFREEAERREKQTLRPEDREAHRRALRCYSEWCRQAKIDGLDAPQAVFQRLKECFERLNGKREERIAAAGKMLDHCFGFLVETFGEGQELVIFLTELSLSYYCMEYLSTCGNAAYDKYVSLGDDPELETVIDAFNE